jgi:hypothetical protein
VPISDGAHASSCRVNLLVFGGNFACQEHIR